MKLFKYELHAHTSEVSSCGRVGASALVQAYKKAGYQGIVITDHFHEEYFNNLGNISWGEKINCYLSGYRNACEEGLRLGMDIFWGLELRFTENMNDFLVYGLNEQYLETTPALFESNIRDFMASVKGMDDVLVFQAHPHRSGCFFTEPPIVHGLEVFNGNPRHSSRNELAAASAEEHNLLVVSGSDFHRMEDLGSGGIEISERVSTFRDLLQVLKCVRHDSLLIREPVSVSVLGNTATKENFRVSISHNFDIKVPVRAEVKME